MPRLWSETIEAHRREVHDAILATTQELVARRGVRSVTMSQIAEQVGIGRATLYKYFPDVDAILIANHLRHVAGHLSHLADLRERPGPPIRRLEAVCDAFALICYHRSRHEHSELHAFLHQDQHVAGVRHELLELFRGLIAEAAQADQVRTDVSPVELAHYCVHALDAASESASQAAVHRLAPIVISALRPADT